MADGRLTRFWTLGRAEHRDSSLACDLFGTVQGLEVRCHDGEAVLKTERVTSMADALNLCEAWKAAYLGQGWRERFE
jgi:hypothetical protein